MASSGLGSASAAVEAPTRPSGGLRARRVAGSSRRSSAETENKSDFLALLLLLAVISSSEAETEAALGELILGLPGGESTSSSTDELLECDLDLERERERERECSERRECRE